MKRITSIETIQTISFEKEKKPLKKLRINVKMTKKCFIDSFAVSHVAFLHWTKYILILLVFLCIPWNFPMHFHWPRLLVSELFSP